MKKKEKNGQNKLPITSGLAQAGAHLVGQFAVFRKFSSRPSVNGNPRLQAKPPPRYLSAWDRAAVTSRVIMK